MVSLLVALGAALLIMIGELFHAARMRRGARLFFGPDARPRHWVRSVPVLRSLAGGGLAWGLVTLMTIVPSVHESDRIPDEEWRHLVLVLDVSPSMMLRDSGPGGRQSRRERAKELVDSLFERVPIGKFKISVIATFNGAKPVVEEAAPAEPVVEAAPEEAEAAPEEAEAAPEEAEAAPEEAEAAPEEADAVDADAEKAEE